MTRFRTGFAAAMFLCTSAANLPAAANELPLVRSATVAQAAAVPATLTGTVRTSGGIAVANANVTVTGPARATATTARDGTFTLAVPQGVYGVTVSKGGYVTASLRDVAVVAGESQPLAIALAQSDLSSLRTIASVTSNARGGGSTINTGAATTSYIPAQAFTNLANPQINDVLQRTPDITIQHMGSQADTTIIVGGAQPYETQVLIDGHPLALGQYGVWASQYFPSFLVGGAEVQSGPGNTTPFANIAVGGTVNLLTPTFTQKPTAEVVAGFDNYQSQYSDFLSTGSAGKLGYVIGLGTAGSNGPYFGTVRCAVTPESFGAADNQPGNAGIVQFCGDTSGSLFTKGEIVKFKYDFTPATSFEAGFVGAWSGFSPQGAAWGNSIGGTKIERCLTSNPLECTNPGSLALVGQTIPGYVWYPGSSVYNNQTLFDGQFRTSLGSNTLLVRPYIGHIQPEAIVGQYEGEYAANYGPPPGAPGYAAPTYPNGATIPSTFVPTPASPGKPAVGNAFEQNCGVSNFFAFSQLQSPSNTSAVAPNGQQQCFQYPYSSYEQDKLYGTTFSFLHPFGDSLLDLTYDFHGQNVFAYFNSASNISVPLSSDRYSTISLTGYLHLVRNLAVNAGLYDTRWTVSGVQPELANGKPVLDPFGVPVLTGLGRGASRFDPHVAFVFRPTSSVSYRLAYGTSATFPFLGQVSGNASFQPFASSAPQYGAGVLTEKNPNLDPEVSLAFDLGADKRFPNGSVLSGDLQDTVIHNVFETLVQGIQTAGGLEGITAPINVARLRSQLATLRYGLSPRTGLGFNLALAAERSIVDGIPVSAYSPGIGGFPVNNVQICGNGLVTPGIPTCIPYLKGYAQGTYGWRDGTFFELGVEYQGKNNSYFQPPFAQVDATFRRPITKSVEFQLSAQNVLNTNNFDNLPAPNAGVALVAGSATAATATAPAQAIQTSYASTLIPAPPRTVRVQLRIHTGR